MKIWLTSDTHYGHSNIIKYCFRPFKDVKHMDRELQARHAVTVGDDDFLVHLGDVSLVGNPEKDATITRILSSLKGRKILVKGNHDRPKMVQAYRDWGWIVLNELCCDKLYLHHQPIEHNDDLIIHGHSHNTFHKEGFVDVGVDTQIDYSPIDAKTLLNETQYASLKERLVDLWTEKHGCMDIIFGSFVACGENNNFCSTRCMNEKQT